MELNIEDIKEIGINNNLEKEKNISNEQNSFLEDVLGKVINTALDAGIKYLLPDKISKEVIKLKNKIFTKRFRTDLKNTIEKVLKKGKREIGRNDISLRSINEVHQTLYKGNILSNVSNLVNKYIAEKTELGKIDTELAKKITNNSGVIMQNVSTNIENELINQMRELNSLRKYNSEWRKFFETKDFENMKKIYKEIELKMQKVLPIKKVLTEIEEISTLQKLVEGNNGDFELAEKELLRLKKSV